MSQPQTVQLTPDKKISTACSAITITQPFFGAFVLRTNIREATDEESKKITTMATDGREIIWNRKFVDGLSVPEVVGVLVHEVLHIVFKHMLRRSGRDPAKWNTACDYVIDPIVLSMGLKLPTGPDLEHHHDTQYDGKSAEQVYALLPDEPPSGKGYGSGIGGVTDMKNEDGSSMSQSEADTAEMEIDQLTIIAAESAKHRGDLPGGLAEHVKKLREPKVDWQSVLRRFVGGDFPEGYNTRRPNRPMYHLFDMIEPTIEKTGVGHIVLAIDTSGSVSNDELAQFLGEMNSISEEMQPELITVIHCDAAIQKVQEFERGELIDGSNIKFKGRGGTAVQPVFKYVEKNIEKLDRLIYFTDMEIGDWGRAPDYPVLWVSTSRNAKGPYGETTYVQVGR